MNFADFGRFWAVLSIHRGLDRVFEVKKQHISVNFAKIPRDFVAFWGHFLEKSCTFSRCFFTFWDPFKYTRGQVPYFAKWPVFPSHMDPLGFHRGFASLARKGCILEDFLKRGQKRWFSGQNCQNPRVILISLDQNVRNATLFDHPKTQQNTREQESSPFYFRILTHFMTFLDLRTAGLPVLERQFWPEMSEID